ncbi:Yip1 family protein [Streptomyces sp. HNM0574]|uniref:YIP1 family protein n=1 Tax=Streptomyces sp. HNM0574 TaxID=2714954 RepID=UPI00146B6C04|nr:YIP1 family protein [Streptomyces sp. HNM0574]
MAGFRIGRGRDDRAARQQEQYPPRPQRSPGASRPAPSPGPGGPAAYGQRPRGGAPAPGSSNAPTVPGGVGQGAYGGGQSGWPRVGGGPTAAGRGHGEPEYFGEPQRPAGHDTHANTPGHTTAFRVPEPYGREDDGGAFDGGYGGDYGEGSTYGGGHLPPPPPSGPRLGWKDLLRGIVTRPNPTFFQMRDYPVWGPALIVTFLYGLLAVFGLDEARDEVINATLGSAIPYVLTTGVAVVLVGLVLGAVTHTLARQFGGTGSWQPTVGLSMLIMALTDAPRLVFAMFLGGTAPLVQVLGWVTWVIAGALFTSMVSRSHDLPWPKALGASAIQLLALLVLMKLGTL